MAHHFDRTSAIYVSRCLSGAHCTDVDYLNKVRDYGWITNYIHLKKLDIITHPCPNFNGGLVKPHLVLWHGWGITPTEITDVKLFLAIVWIDLYRTLIHDDVIKWKHFPRYWPLCGEFTGHRWIPHTKASDAELWCFFFICALNKLFSKQSWGWWFETTSCSLWRHCNVKQTMVALVIIVIVLAPCILSVYLKPFPTLYQ